MRSFVVLGVLVACGSPSPAPERPEPERRDPPCLPFMQRNVIARADGASVVIEQHSSSGSCEGRSDTTVTPLARITLPATPTACPIGQVVLRMWSGGHGSEDKHPAFMASLTSEQRAELRQKLMYFADTAEAFVIDCPSAGHGDYLLVEIVPRSEMPQLGLFVGNQLLEHRVHPRVTFFDANGVAMAPAPIAAAAASRGDCSESLTPGKTRWIGRAVTTGMMPGPSRMRTYAIGRDGDNAAIVIQHHIADKANAKPGAFEWRCDESMTLTGTVTERGKHLVFQVAHGGAPKEVHAVTCTPRDLRVARARAVRVEIPSTMEGCKANRWQPAANVAMRAYECTAEDVVWWQSPVFASTAPGVEHLTIDEDDCGAPSLALRVSTRDGAIAPVRASR